MKTAIAKMMVVAAAVDDDDDGEVGRERRIEDTGVLDIIKYVSAAARQTNGSIVLFKHCLETGVMGERERERERETSKGGMKQIVGQDW